MRRLSLIRPFLALSRDPLTELLINPASRTPLPAPFLPPQLHSLRWLSSSAAVQRRDQKRASAIADIFCDTLEGDTAARVSAAGVSLTSKSVASVLRELGSVPNAALSFFSWASDSGRVKIGNQCYNAMLKIAASGCAADDFRVLVGRMRENGFGISLAVYKAALESLGKLGMAKEAEMLKELCVLNLPEDVVPHMEVLYSEDCDDEVRAKLNNLDPVTASESAVAVLRRVQRFPRKALVFFRWLEETSLSAVDGKVYSLIARILGCEDCIEEFWNVLRAMEGQGHTLERAAYVKIVQRFLSEKLIADAVEVYEFAMRGSSKLTVHDFTALLKKLVTKMDSKPHFITRIVRCYVHAGNSIGRSTFDAVCKSLREVRKLGECRVVLKAMEDGGFTPDSAVHGCVVSTLCAAGRPDEALKHADEVEESGYMLEPNVWTIIMQKHRQSGDLDSALLCLDKMLQRKGLNGVGPALDVLVRAFCKEDGVIDAFKFVKQLVTKIGVKPSHGTYKYLIEMLAPKGVGNEAITLIGLMKNDGFTPYIKPFITSIAKSGTADDAVKLLGATAGKPTRANYMRLFRGLFNEGRNEVAQQLLSEAPGSIRNHADVLELFYSMRQEEATTRDVVIAE